MGFVGRCYNVEVWVWSKSLSLLMVRCRIEYFLGLKKNNNKIKKLSHDSLKFGVGMENVDLCFGHSCYLVLVFTTLQSTGNFG